jgi:hypothetical protein
MALSFGGVSTLSLDPVIDFRPMDGDALWSAHPDFHVISVYGQHRYSDIVANFDGRARAARKYQRHAPSPSFGLYNSQP